MNYFSLVCLWPQEGENEATWSSYLLLHFRKIIFWQFAHKSDEDCWHKPFCLLLPAGVASSMNRKAILIILIERFHCRWLACIQTFREENYEDFKKVLLACLWEWLAYQPLLLKCIPHAMNLSSHQPFKFTSCNIWSVDYLDQYFQIKSNVLPFTLICYPNRPQHRMECYMVNQHEHFLKDFTISDRSIRLQNRSIIASSKWRY